MKYKLECNWNENVYVNWNENWNVHWNVNWNVNRNVDVERGIFPKALGRIPVQNVM